MIRVLVADSLERFLALEHVPDDVAADLFPPDQIPSGPYAGIVPDITRTMSADDLIGLPHLRIIANYGAGYDNIDLAAAHERGIAVTNTPGVLTGATAELTWALILAVTRRIGEGERLVRRGGWQGWQPADMLGWGLDGKVLGIIGAGRIGQEVGARAAAFGMHVVYASRSAHDDWASRINATRVDMDDLLGMADVITLHVAWVEATTRLIGAAELQCMKPTAILVNTSRGKILDEAALSSALTSGRMRGAGLDVYEAEPHVPAELVGLENVVLLPHLGSATEEARLAMWQLAWRNLLAGVRGEPLPNPVDWRANH